MWKLHFCLFFSIYNSKTKIFYTTLSFSSLICYWRLGPGHRRGPCVTDLAQFQRRKAIQIQWGGHAWEIKDWVPAFRCICCTVLQIEVLPLQQTPRRIIAKNKVQYVERQCGQPSTLHGQSRTPGSAASFKKHNTTALTCGTAGVKNKAPKQGGSATQSWLPR